MAANAVFVYNLKNRKSVITRQESVIEMDEIDQTARKRTLNSENDVRVRLKAENERSFIVMLVITTGSYLVLTLVSAVIFATIFRVAMQGSPEEFLFANILGTLPTMLNNSLNFAFFYSSGPMFRNALRAALKK